MSLSENADYLGSYGNPKFAMISTLAGAGLKNRVKELFTKLLLAEASVE